MYIIFHIMAGLPRQEGPARAGAAAIVVYRRQPLCYTQFQIILYQFQIKDDLKAARIETARRTYQYVKQPKTSQR